MRKYFVSYRFSGGFGACQINRELPFIDFNDVMATQMAIQRDRSAKGEHKPEDGNIIITGWQLFETQ